MQVTYAKKDSSQIIRLKGASAEAQKRREEEKEKRKRRKMAQRAAAASAQLNGTPATVGHVS